MPSSPRPLFGIFYPLLVAAAASVLLAALLGAATSGWLAGHGWAWPSLLSVPAALHGWVMHWPDPAQGWPAEPRPGPALLTYLLGTGTLALEAVLWIKVLLWRRRVLRQRAEARSGLADRATVRNRLGAEAVTKHAYRLRPSLAGSAHISADDAGALFARWPGTDEGIYGTHEDSKLVVAPVRMGKTGRQAVSDVLRAPGALVATSTRFDLIELTIMQRTQRGQVWVFDPEKRVPWPEKLRWNPIHGCEDFDVALRRAVAICSARPLEDTKNGGYFSGKSEGVLAAMLHAAALSGTDLATLWLWTTSQSYRPAQILETDNRAAPAIADGLRNLLDSLKSTSDTSGAGGIYSTLELLLRPLTSPKIMRALTPAPGDATFDIDSFIRSDHDTLYMVSRGRKNSAAPMVNALMVEMLHRADLLSQRPTAQQLTAPAHGDLRLDPPLRIVMDEAANITPVDDLSARLADSGGRGIQLYVYVQNLSQLRQRWGLEEATEIWDCASIKLVLGGLSNSKDLLGLSELLPERIIDQASVSTGPASRGQITVSPWRRRALTVDEIRELRDGEGLLFYRNLRAAKVDLPGWWETPDLTGIVTHSRGEVRRLLACAHAAHTAEPSDTGLHTPALDD
ncbi:type IV secretory system conjugative DNA transfer family protein [Lentzea jiangxiensis]|uniref:type IV secretory system conjugative DNA transfer family protein n=1 Tax=Lentzea jiangxiensis TaxID=641025 RepID=UPI0015A17911|nr:type IV secretory system conjugative DNA transfer family protein [Lentzea jiangxiensis]